MTLNEREVTDLASHLDQALQQGLERERLTAQVPDLSLEDAYRIQAAGIKLRLARGERIVGWKMGLTSKAKRDQMGLHLPIFGVLTDTMLIPNGRMSLSGAIHPKVEPEVAFRLARPLSGGDVTEAHVLDACDAVCAALEILDSRYVGFKYFSLPDVVADNASSSKLVIGPWIPVERGRNYADLLMAMSVNGAVREEARSSAISGNPLTSVVQLVQLLANFGQSLPAGATVLAGAATTAVPLERGMEVSLKVTSLPPVKFIVE